jgi:hypothetical protein
MQNLGRSDLLRLTNKYFKSLSIVCLVIVFLIPFVVFAQDYSIPNPFGANSSIWDIIGRVINFLYYIAIIAGTFAIIYAGYLFLFSAGEIEKVKIAKKLIIYALIGIIVVFLSKGIINILLKEVLGSSVQIK